ncbi:beta family protein [Geomonas anaerohicana]|uniref:Beta family protein n=1 Tax=Geomonas anaerohicana TaxID=2798583 RepID=A0ABS0YK28_9BACT|nr:beta family protein [Geomonas anaerohicana]MBJ6752696.1 beta family protein [Geomonas anaerohicana]
MYIPFLKLKKNEIMSMCGLDVDTIKHVIPFFDVPRVRDMTEGDFKKRIELAEKDMKRHWAEKKRFYLDTFDVDQDLRPDGVCPCEYAMIALGQYNPIPVVGLDRDSDHLDFVRRHLAQARKKDVAVRLLPDIFESYELVADELSETLGDILAGVDNIDLVLDCRIVNNYDVSAIAQSAAEFASTFCEDYACRNVIVTGSSIPPSISDIVQTNSSVLFDRKEPQLWRVFNQYFSDESAKSVFGDYAVVSPEYSDVDLGPEMLSTIASPKAIYTLEDQHFAVRGSRFRTHKDGYAQYYAIARQIARQAFFRGELFSSGDEYIQRRSENVPTPGSPQSWIKNTLNAHVTYIVSEVCV